MELYFPYWIHPVSVLKPENISPHLSNFKQHLHFSFFCLRQAYYILFSYVFILPLTTVSLFVLSLDQLTMSSQPANMTISPTSDQLTALQKVSPITLLCPSAPVLQYPPLDWEAPAPLSLSERGFFQVLVPGVYLYSFIPTFLLIKPTTHRNFTLGSSVSSYSDSLLNPLPNL